MEQIKPLGVLENRVLLLQATNSLKTVQLEDVQKSLSEKMGVNIVVIPSEYSFLGIINK